MNRQENPTPPTPPSAEAVQKKEETTNIERRGGREIEGLEAKPERFSRLEEGRDYELVQVNPAITADQRVQDFVIFVNPSEGTETRVVQPPHWRTVTSPGVRTTFHLATEGKDITIPFYTANTKGVGYLKPTVRDKSIDDIDVWVIKDQAGEQRSGYKVLGLSGEHEYLKGGIIEKSNLLLGQGLRCEAYWGLAELKQVYYQGKLVPVETLKRKGIILNRKNYIPEEGVRLFKTNDRIEEVYRSDERRLELFRSAFETFNRETKDTNLPLPEIHIGNIEEERIYFKEFFRRMGSNMATLLNIGYSHIYLHSSNVTLAAEIADIGTMKHHSENKDKNWSKSHNGVFVSHIKDMRDIVYGLRYLMKAGKDAELHTGKREDLAVAFLDGFDSVFDPPKVQEQGSDPTKSREWMRKILDAVIVRRENLPSLVYNEIEDWGIE